MSNQIPAKYFFGDDVSKHTTIPPSDFAYQIKFVDLNCKAEFKYNYFVIDEKTSSQKNVINPPRQVNLSWDNIKSFAKDKGILSQHTDKILNNDLNANYVVIPVQDLNLLSNVQTRLTSSIVKNQLTSMEGFLPITNDVLNNISTTSLDDSSEVQYVYNDKKINLFNDLRQNFSVTVNRGVLPDLIDAINRSSIAQFGDALNDYKNLENPNQGLKYYFGESYDTLLNVENGFTFIPDNKIVGYFIDKYFYNNGNFELLESILIDDGSQFNYTDTDILYGKRYAYSIRSIISVKLLLLDSNFKLKLGSYLLEGKASNLSIISCVENVAPPPPVDLSFHYNYDERALHVMWNMPPNPQQDIKGYLVFKRTSIMEPFQLMRMYDFNDALDRYPLPEYLLNSDVLVYSNSTYGIGRFRPILSFIDTNYDKTKPQIYSIVSYDAHGFYSNFSLQVEITWDKIYQKIVKSLISRPGAPLPYPNLLIEQDLFADTMFVEQFNRMKISFDPAAKILNKNKKFENLYSFNQTSVNSNLDDAKNKYVFNIINVDNQNFRQVTVKIFDKEEIIL